MNKVRYEDQRTNLNIKQNLCLENWSAFAFFFPLALFILFTSQIFARMHFASLPLGRRAAEKNLSKCILIERNDLHLKLRSFAYNVIKRRFNFKVLRRSYTNFEFHIFRSDFVERSTIAMTDGGSYFEW